MSFFEDEVVQEDEKREEISRELFWSEIKKPKQKKNTASVLLAVMVALICIFVACVIVLNMVLGKGWFTNAFKNDSGVSLTIEMQDKPEIDDEYIQEDGRYTVEGVAKVASASVVSIIGYGEDDETDEYTYAGQGSGVIFTSNGYIITNAHVVSSATKGIIVVDSDNNEYEAKIIGYDTASDIAVIKVSGEFTPIEIGDSTQTELGEQVVAIGNPAGYSGSVTTGVVSGTNRMVKGGGTGTSMSCLQIDAAINPGSSGGALLNMWGQLIGITSSKLTSEKYDGIGFAISTEAAIPIVEEIIENGYVAGRARVGITYIAVSSEQAEEYNVMAGLYVQSVDEDCDSANVLQVGDIILELDGQSVEDSETVEEIMNSKRAGDTMTVKFFRPDSEDSTTGETLEGEFTLEEDTSDQLVVVTTDGYDE